MCVHEQTETLIYQIDQQKIVFTSLQHFSKAMLDIGSNHSTLEWRRNCVEIDIIDHST